MNAKSIGKFAIEKGMSERILRNVMDSLRDEVPPDSLHQTGSGRISRRWYFTPEQEAKILPVYRQMTDPEWVKERQRQGQLNGAAKAAKKRSEEAERRRYLASGKVMFDLLVSRLEAAIARLDEIEKHQRSLMLRTQSDATAFAEGLQAINLKLETMTKAYL